MQAGAEECGNKNTTVGEDVLVCRVVVSSIRDGVKRCRAEEDGADCIYLFIYLSIDPSAGQGGGPPPHNTIH